MSHFSFSFSYLSSCFFNRTYSTYSFFDWGFFDSSLFVGLGCTGLDFDLPNLTFFFFGLFLLRCGDLGLNENRILHIFFYGVFFDSYNGALFLFLPSSYLDLLRFIEVDPILDGRFRDILGIYLFECLVGVNLVIAYLDRPFLITSLLFLFDFCAFFFGIIFRYFGLVGVFLADNTSMPLFYPFSTSMISNPVKRSSSSPKS